VSITDGLFNVGLFQAEIKRTLIDISEQAVLITDHTKFGQASGMIVASLDRIDRVITDSQAPEQDINQLRQMGISVTLVDALQDTVALRQAFIPGIQAANNTLNLRADSQDPSLFLS
jgi:hypothetical protein